MMKRIKNVRWATQGITAVLLFGMAFVAGGAEQMMRALPAPAVAQPTAVVAPAGMPPVATPPSPNTPMLQKKLVPSIPGGGVMQVSPAAACGMNNTPRIGSINGRSSGGIVFQPGDKLDIVGCGFGYQGREGRPAELVGNGQQISLIIDTWNDAHITAHIDAGKTGIPDLDSIKLKVWPYGAPILSDVAHKFRAARETIQVALPATVRRNFSDIYGPRNSISLSNSPDGKSTIVERNSEQNSNRKIYLGFCPAVTSQQGWMTDEFLFEGGIQSLLNEGFVVDGVQYQNLTQQDSTDDRTWQMVLVGGPGQAIYFPSQSRINVTFQGHSTYVKKMVFSDEGGRSLCTSRYAVSLSVSGPRGVKPFRS